MVYPLPSVKPDDGHFVDLWYWAILLTRSLIHRIEKASSCVDLLIVCD